MAARSKSRKKRKAAKRPRGRRAFSREVEASSAESLPQGQFDTIELPPDLTPEPVPVEVVGREPDPPPPPTEVNLDELPPESGPRSQEEKLVEPLPAVPPPVAEEAPVGPIKILVVEDGSFLRLGIKRALERAGYAVVAAADGEAGIEEARRSHPDLILLDLLLPKMGGQDVLRTLKKDPATAGISVVVLTGLSQRNADRLQADGALAFLEKSDLGLDKGPEVLLAALSAIVQQLLRARGRKRATAAALGR
jgi:CheY-like chemotaxis protein